MGPVVQQPKDQAEAAEPQADQTTALVGVEVTAASGQMAQALEVATEALAPQTVLPVLRSHSHLEAVVDHEVEPLGLVGLMPVMDL